MPSVCLQQTVFLQPTSPTINLISIKPHMAVIHAMYVWLQKSTAALNSFSFFEELRLSVSFLVTTEDHGLSQTSFARALLFNADNNWKDWLVLVSVRERALSNHISFSGCPLVTYHRCHTVIPNVLGGDKCAAHLLLCWKCLSFFKQVWTIFICYC